MWNVNRPEGLLPLGGMASLLGVQARELRKAAEKGEVPCVRIGETGLLFDPTAVITALRQRAGGQGSGVLSPTADPAAPAMGKPRTSSDTEVPDGT